MDSPHRYPTVSRRLVSAEQVKQLSRYNVPRWIGFVLLEWAVIIATLVACVQWPHWYVWLPAILIIGTRQHALSILGHEAVHHVVTRSRPLNDALANYFTCYPLMITVEGYRRSHLKHHWYLETPNDPSKITVEHHPEDWTFPMSFARVANMLARDLTGLSQASSASLLKYLWDIPNRAWHLSQIVLFHAVLAGALAWAGYWYAYLVLWLVPMFTVVVACYRIRGIAEHSGFGDPARRYKREEIDSLVCTRTSVHCPLLSAVFAPYNVSYHIEHHMYPAIPAFELRRLHEILSQHPDYARHAHITRGYKALFAELTGRPTSEGGAGLSAGT